MQPYFVLVLVLVACVATVPVGVGASLTASTSSIEKPSDVRARMLLRERDEDGKERTLDTGNSLLSKLKNALAAFPRKSNTPPEVRGWIKEKKTPDDVFNALKLDDGLETLLENQKLHLWVAFVNKFNKKNPGREVNMLGTITKKYGDEAVAKMLETAKQNPSTAGLATALQNEQQVAWMVNGLSPDFVFQWFKLDKGTVEELLTNPALGVWYHFFHNLNQYNPDRDVTMITKLLNTYDDISLAKAISAAMKDDTMQLVASRLQEAQFQKWLLDGRNPDAISKLLLKDRMGWKHQGIFRAYKTFYDDANKVDDLDTLVAVASVRRS